MTFSLRPRRGLLNLFTYPAHNNVLLTLQNTSLFVAVCRLECDPLLDPEAYKLSNLHVYVRRHLDFPISRSIV